MADVVENPKLDELEIAIADFIFDKGVDPENRLLIYCAGHDHLYKADDIAISMAKRDVIRSTSLTLQSEKEIFLRDFRSIPEYNLER